MTDYLSLPETQRELVSFLRGDSHTWGEAGRLLGSVELHGIWREEAGSFTEWLKKFAERLGKKESSLWRYFTAGRYYIELQKKMLTRNFKCPTLQNLPDRISPENLEILSKLERVAPPEVMQTLSEHVVGGVATRSELRDAWKIFRPVLAGQTARGRPTPPRFDPTDLSQRDSYLEARFFSALSNKNESVLTNSQFDFYELFTQVTLKLDHPRKGVMVLDAVAVTGNKSKSELIFHGIEVVGLRFSHAYKNLEPLQRYCDFVWIATHEKNFEEFRTSVPENVGCLVINDSGEIKISLAATRGINSGLNSGELAKMLLLEMLAQ